MTLRDDLVSRHIGQSNKESSVSPVCTDGVATEGGRA